MTFYLCSFMYFSLIKMSMNAWTVTYLIVLLMLLVSMKLVVILVTVPRDLHLRATFVLVRMFTYMFVLLHLRTMILLD